MLKESVLHTLKKLLPAGQVFTDSASLISYEVDAGLDKGRPEGVAFPRNTKEVMRLIRWAAEHNVPLVARGAGTGLSGGAVADQGGIIVEFSHMNRILDVDIQGRSAVVEPAMINLRLDERVKPEGLYFPPDPASQRASTIGGNVAENSGGPHCFKYGVTTNYIMGMEVVLADGKNIHIGGHARDYPEYDLVGLITGSEGMLALITSITVRLVRNPPGVSTLLAIFDSVEQAGTAVSAIIAAGLVPATMEMMDQKIIGIVEPFAHAGLPLDAGAVLIIEVDGYPESLDRQMDEVKGILEAHGGKNMRIARDEEERYKIWLARKSSAGAIARLSPAFYIIDITVPRSRLTDMLIEVDRICSHYQLRSGHVFHAGDGNLHPNLLIPEPDNPDLLKRVHAAAWEMVKFCVDMGGSLTGEHGVGIEKRQFMPLMHNAAELMAMWDIKQAFDPACLLNPGKLFPLPTENDKGPFAGYVLPAGNVVNQSYPSNHLSNGVQLSAQKFMPTTKEEAAQGLLALVETGQKVRITNAEDVADGIVQLGTKKLGGIKTYAPDDLYITVGSGATLAEVQSFLSLSRKQLALASPWPEATIGGLVAANINAPLRMRYSGLRDLVLCATVALADGRVIRTGRPIVKNVAGFDLTKAFIGSHGTLGLLTDISLKIMVQPRAKHTLLFPVEDMRSGLIWSRHMLPLALTASAIVLCKDYRRTGVPQSNYLLAYTAEGMPEDVQAELAQVRQSLQAADGPKPTEVEEITGTDIWAELLGAAPALKVRVGLPARDLPAYIQDQSALLNAGPFIADIASGLVYATGSFSDAAEANAWLEALRQPALTMQGYAVVMETPGELRDQIDRWGYRPESLDVMKRLKTQWDPRGIMNPGQFVVGL